MDKKPIIHFRQSGQAMVFVLIFTTVLVVGMTTLYKAGKLTSDKMQLQNAADAAAYSVSVVEARDLNFASYMNRAIVADEVAIGQLIGLSSFAFHWRSFHDYLKLYSVPLSVPPITPLGRTLDKMATFFKKTGDPLVKYLPPIFDKGITTVHRINKFYSFSQSVYHLGSAFFALGQVQEMIDQNGPDNAQLSDYGMLSLIGHLATYGSTPGLPGEKFTRTYKPNPKKKTSFADFQKDIAGDTNAGGYGRLAALIHESGDPFVNARGWVFDFFKELNKLTPLPSWLYSERNGQGWLGPDIGDTWNFRVVKVRWRLWLQLHIDLTRAGGSELRFIQKTTGPKKKRDQVSGKRFMWSSADATDLGLGIDGGFTASYRLCDPTGLAGCTKWYSLPGGSINAVNGRIKAYINLPIVGKKKLLDRPFPTDVPFGAGFAQAGLPAKKGEPSTFIGANKKQIGIAFDPPVKKSDPLKAFSGPVPTGRYQDYPDYDGPSEWPNAGYGGAASSTFAWTFPLPPGIFYQAGMGSRQVNKNYSGLPAYIDTAMNNPIHDSGGPNIVLGVELTEANFDLKNPAPGQAPADESEPKGRFEITEKMAKKQLHSIAKAEVYFKRPSDLSYFLRADKQTEYGSAFNPYWSARLTETSHADRELALFMQQDVDINNNSSSLGTVSSLMQPIIKLLNL